MCGGPLNIIPGQIINCDQQQAVSPFGNLGNLLGSLWNLGAGYGSNSNIIYYPASVWQNIAYQPYPNFQQLAVPAKAAPEVKENSAMRTIKQLAIQDKSNHPIGSKLVSEEKTLAAVDLCRF
jgi:hypothetical protein